MILSPSPLFIAIEKHDIQAIKLFIRHNKVDINAKYANTTAVGYSMTISAWDIFDLLLEKYPGVEICEVALKHLIIKQQSGIIETLSTKINYETYKKAFSRAIDGIFKYNKDFKNFGELLSFIFHNEIIARVLKECGYFLEPAVLSNDMRLFDQLVAAGADVTIQPPDGTTPLDFAKHIGNKECIRLLEIALGIRTLAKFTTAIEKGFIGSHGKSGIKVFRKKISQHESIETLYELKIYSSQYGELRLYTKDVYVNEKNEKLVIFKDLGNHRDVALAARESNGIVEHRP